MLTKTLLYGEFICSDADAEEFGNDLRKLDPGTGVYFSLNEGLDYLPSYGPVGTGNGYLVATESLGIRSRIDELSKKCCSHAKVDQRELLDFDSLSRPVPEHEASNDEIVTKAPKVFR